MEKKTVSLKNLLITGYEGDYILNTIERTQDFYEAYILSKWSPMLASPKCILDVGANLGNHTLFWAGFFPEARIISLEPFPDNYAFLKENVEQNKLSNVLPICAAAGEKPGFAHVTHFEVDNLGATTFQFSDSEEDGKTAEVKTLDSIAKQLKLREIDLVKIDTEGFEVSVLKGMTAILEKDRPVLWVECGGTSVSTVLEFLQARNYIPVDLESANLLFFPKEKAPESKLTLETLLSANLALVDRVNQYYKNYAVSKQWLAEKDEQLEALRKQLAGVTEKAEKNAENYETSKSWLTEKDRKLEMLTEQLAAARENAEQILARAEQYRSNYEAGKEWLAEKDKQLEALREQLAGVAEKAEKNAENYEKSKSWLAEKDRKLEALTEQLAAARDNAEQILARAEQYRSNYETGKEWLAAKDKQLESLREQLAKATEKAEKNAENYETCKEWLVAKDEQMESLREQLAKATEKAEKNAENYETCKEWLAAKNEQVEALRKQLARVTE
ncbi:MAG: FkbM family methyltransferase [Clostridia bacterium]|nr:FkbM family methyltransferase [Clostridia bacterium]